MTGRYDDVDDEGRGYDEDALSFGDEDEDYEILKILKMGMLELHLDFT
jgi:hypothetical protein